ncbi:MAG TPA: tonB-system energizer ExbB [Xanthobacteraceae bacterium]|nr:tonB-system energizer ExbB [Xanthobacteraceae bacterium]
MTNLSRTTRVAAVAILAVFHSVQVQAQQAPGAPPQLSQPAAPPAVAVPPSTAEISPPASGAGRPSVGIGPLRELSPWSMFLSADILVKAVMVGLICASLATWTLFFAKMVQLSRARKEVGSALARISGIRSLSEAQLALGAAPNVLSELLASAMQEIQLSDAAAEDAGIKERAASRFSEIVRMEARAVRSGIAVVATIGATAPFVGLFGTVWGIMNSFVGISKAQTTNLAVVAPGIAEALLATALGLATAIPAVIIYNHFSRSTRSYLDLVGRGSGAIGRLLSRDLDRFRNRIASRAAE